MVLKINDVRGLGQAQAPSLSGGSSAAPSKPADSGKSEPAARIGLSEAAKSTQALPLAVAADTPDMALVQEIRERIAQGTFEIDYQKVANNLLGNAVAAVRAGHR
ncbi:flagellar biosynthesis anti-sigma factor FlgM [Limnohabitans lacus]|jgi:flagellar biosynthesis anti-sigma factor FlgM|uniref:Negative regulator of flagellin synthesis n=1 Tax=Limnohabitans lacus TaxID=3045173 RepID=A0ABT6X9S1_9BURK|nr:flagellar biosynthesis anti-sigma factor FlgM [Limnohabitans sp. HM2-2]MDI9234662.1 flagellar biosynthesis anti-sigma factor FlgM [Limnohabitans sp. HM2-2]